MIKEFPKVTPPKIGDLELYYGNVKEEEVETKEEVGYKDTQEFLAKAKTPLKVRISIWILGFILTTFLGYLFIEILIENLINNTSCKDKYLYILIGAILTICAYCIYQTITYIYSKYLKKYINEYALLRSVKR